MKSLTRLIFVFLALVICAGASNAQSVRIEASTRVIQGQRFTLTFVVTNGDARMSREMAPQLPGCTLLFGPAQSTMRSVEIINGRQSSTSVIRYTFTYLAEKAGTVTVPATKIQVDGKQMSTEPRKITIVSADKAPQSSAPRPDIREEEDWRDPDVGYPNGERINTKVGPNDLIVAVNLSKSSIYEKEAVIATIRLYTKHNITNFQPTVMPQFEGFLSEEIPVGQQTAQPTTYRGEKYYTVVLKKCLLFPQKSGKLTINSGSYDVTLQTYDYVSQGFFATPIPREYAIKTTSNSVTVNVKPLPTPAPAGFNGAVGDFTVSATLSPERLRTNEAATYTFSVKGSGNLKHLAEPKIPFPVSVEEYAPTSSADVNFSSDNISGAYTATYTIVPQEQGQLDIPSWEFAYFNPATGQYVTTTIPGFEREVAKGLPAAGSSSSSQTVDTSAITDIRHIKKVDEKSLSHERSPLFYNALYILAYILALAMLIAAAIIYRRYITASADVQGRRLKKARSVASRRLQKAREAMSSRNTDLFYDALAAAMWGYLSDRLRMSASSLTRDNIADALAGITASPELISEVINILDQCEMARFTPSHSESEMATLFSQASSVIDRLEHLKPAKQTSGTPINENRYAD